MTEMESVSTLRLYGAVIAIVSGIYSGYLSVSGASMSTGSWFMVGLGAIVLVHGIVLLTPVAVRLGELSGPLMIGYSMLMLLNQLRVAAGWTGSGGMDRMNGGMSGSGMGSMTEMATMAPDAGMVAISVLMLASGLIMTVRREMMSME